MEDEATTANTSRSEAERLLGISEKLLQSRDLTGSREFALLAQESEPFLEGSDQILAITDVLLASERRVNNNRLHSDFYAILQTDRRSEPDLVKKNYRRLALLLHPDKNKFPFADTSFKLVADAWSVLSDPAKRASFDREFNDLGHDLNFFAKVDLQQPPPPPTEKDKLPVRRSSRGGGEAANANAEQSMSFWTACPYCYVLYEYDKYYEECCLKCRNCARAFHASSIPALPPMVPGEEAYYCCWGFFPLGFSVKDNKEAVDDRVRTNDNNNNGYPNWMPGMFAPPMGAGAPTPPQVNIRPNINATVAGVDAGFGVSERIPSGGFVIGLANNNTGSVGRARGYTVAAQGSGMPTQGARKRGRPKKNPFPS